MASLADSDFTVTVHVPLLESTSESVLSPLVPLNATCFDIDGSSALGRSFAVRDINCDLEVLVDHTLEYELTIGHCIDSCKWDDKGGSLLITATNGHLWCFDFSSK